MQTTDIQTMQTLGAGDYRAKVDYFHGSELDTSGWVMVSRVNDKFYDEQGEELRPGLELVEIDPEPYDLSVDYRAELAYANSQFATTEGKLVQASIHIEKLQDQMKKQGHLVAVGTLMSLISPAKAHNLTYTAEDLERVLLGLCHTEGAAVATNCTGGKDGSETNA